MVGKNFSSKCLGQKKCCKKNFRQKNFFVDENFCLAKFFWSAKNFVSKEFWSAKILVQNVQANKNVVKKIFGQKIFWQENFLVNETFGKQKFFVKQNFCQLIIIDSEILLSWKMFDQ